MSGEEWLAVFRSDLFSLGWNEETDRLSCPADIAAEVVAAVYAVFV